VPIRAKTPMVSTTETSKLTPFLGVDYSVLLPRERSECVEILLERFPRPATTLPISAKRRGPIKNEPTG